MTQSSFNRVLMSTSCDKSLPSRQKASTSRSARTSCICQTGFRTGSVMVAEQWKVILPACRNRPMIEPGNAHVFAIGGEADESEMRIAQVAPRTASSVIGGRLRDRPHAHDFLRRIFERPGFEQLAGFSQQPRAQTVLSHVAGDGNAQHRKLDLEKIDK